VERAGRLLAADHGDRLGQPESAAVGPDHHADRQGDRRVRRNEQFIPVRFTVSSSGTPSATTGSGTTNAAGQTTFSYSNGTAGSDTVTAWADLDEDNATDAGETTQVTVVWQKHPTVAAYTGPTVGEYHDPLTVSDTLHDALSGDPVAGMTLTIGIGTDTCTGVTNAGGAATCGFTPQQVPGPYTATASFAGSSQYAATTSPGGSGGSQRGEPPDMPGGVSPPGTAICTGFAAVGSDWRLWDGQVSGAHLVSPVGVGERGSSSRSGRSRRTGRRG
jgi:hypothetical protein